jgi:pimeloyl-ACP methyl ester carboxylesterase
VTNTPRPTIVLIHGAWHGPWCWDELRPSLRAFGWETTAPGLPSVSTSATRPSAGLHDDVAALLDHVEHIDGPVVLVAHSYAGLPATQVAALCPDKVRQVIYLAAYVPHASDNLFGLHGLATPEDVSGTVPVPAEPLAMFYADVEHAAALAAVARLRPQSLRSWTERVGQVHLSQPTTYFICQNDQALPRNSQEAFAARADRVELLVSGHSPFLSQPQELAAQLEQALQPKRPDRAVPQAGCRDDSLCAACAPVLSDSTIQ